MSIDPSNIPPIRITPLTPPPGKQPVSSEEAALIALKNTIGKLEEAIKPVLGKASALATQNTVPVTEKTLTINGVSYLLIYDPKFPNDPSKAMAFPISHTSDAGGAGVPKCTSTESIWYYMKVAYNNGDKQLFQELMNGYNYLVQQKAAIVKAGGDTAAGASTPGLAGWLVDLGAPPGTTFKNDKLPYPQKPYDPALSTATDADMGIINLMILGEKKFGNLDLHSFGTFAGGAQPTDVKLADLKNQALKTFLNYNISNKHHNEWDKAHTGFIYQGVTYNPVLCNDNWGGGDLVDNPPPPRKPLGKGTFLNPSYFDPETLTTIYKEVLNSKDPEISSQAPRFKEAIVNSVKYLQAMQNNYKDPKHENSFGMPDNPAWDEKDGPNKDSPHMVGWDSIRFLAHAGNFLKSGEDVFGIAPQMKDMSTKMMNYLKTNMTDGVLKYPDGSTLHGGALYGPIAVFMKATKDPEFSTYEKLLKGAVQVDPNKMKENDPKAYLYWQDQYYGSLVGMIAQEDLAK